jgi:hypothetical protein
MKNTINQEIEDFATYLKMPVLKSSYQEAIQEANIKETSYEQFLWELLQRECDRRQENAKQDRVRRAAFPYKKYLEDIIVEDLPEDARKKFKTLSSLDFIQTGQNKHHHGRKPRYRENAFGYRIGHKGVLSRLQSLLRHGTFAHQPTQGESLRKDTKSIWK